MRSREEIVEMVSEGIKAGALLNDPMAAVLSVTDAQLEILMDIRDLMNEVSAKLTAQYVANNLK